MAGKMALISDIHSNIEALTAVLRDIDKRHLDRIVCLGDVVGYGANPRECVDLVASRCEVCLCGNHDQAVLYEPANFNVGAERACFWTRRLLEQEPDREKLCRRWDFIGRLPIRHVMDGMLFVHASPRKPVNEYLFSEDVYTNPAKITENFRRMEETEACFVGHTHVPGVFLDDPYFDPPDELPEPRRYPLGEEKAIINVGSVGQPRDRDPRASYALINGDNEVEFLRVEYDIETAMRKIQAVPELDDFLGTRLTEGR
ncbi:MAG: metallophosphoesterase family protein [Phycisphaerae bacterium]|nr:metallophosphoesterase family protein [Phycisphaerae bacterium]